MTRPIYVITPLVADPYDPAGFASLVGGLVVMGDMARSLAAGVRWKKVQ